MTDFFYLIPVALVMGAIGLAAFLWSLRSGQYDDLDGAAERILFDDEHILPMDKRSSAGEGRTPDTSIEVSNGRPSN